MQRSNLPSAHCLSPTWLPLTFFGLFSRQSRLIQKKMAPKNTCSRKLRLLAPSKTNSINLHDLLNIKRSSLDNAQCPVARFSSYFFCRNSSLSYEATLLHKWLSDASRFFFPSFSYLILCVAQARKIADILLLSTGGSDRRSSIWQMKEKGWETANSPLLDSFLPSSPMLVICHSPS